MQPSNRDDGNQKTYNADGAERQEEQVLRKISVQEASPRESDILLLEGSFILCSLSGECLLGLFLLSIELDMILRVTSAPRRPAQRHLRRFQSLLCFLLAAFSSSVIWPAFLLDVFGTMPSVMSRKDSWVLGSTQSIHHCCSWVVFGPNVGGAAITTRRRSEEY